MQEVGMPDENTPAEGGNENGADGAKEFKAITSQADLDRIIGDRIARERGKFADYDDLKEKAAKFDEAEQANLSELDKEKKAREAAEGELAKYRQRDEVAGWAKEVSESSGVPADLLRGSTKDELAAHAEQLKPHFTKAPPKKTATPPGTSREDKGGSRAAAALRELRRGA